MTTLLDEMLAAATPDQKTADRGGDAHEVPLLDGMRIHRTMPRRDQRGHLTEIFDRRWGWHDEPLEYGYVTTILPGVVKGWALHKTHEDRYFVLNGEMELVTFDPRPDSPTLGKLSRVVLSGSEPCIINVPRYVWHADHNICTSEVVLLSFPTKPYDHENPDKYRLPIDTPLIPHHFGKVGGW